MADPVYSRYEIVSKTADCVQLSDPKQDKCRVQAVEQSSDVENYFTMERKDGKFFSLTSSDTSKVQKLFPAFSVPTIELKDYLVSKGEFFKVFGDKDNPTEFAKKDVKLSATESDNLARIENYTNLIASFIATGDLYGTHATKQSALIEGLNASIFAYADPKMGPKITEILGKIDKNSDLSAGARERLNWLLGVQESWNVLWNHIQPAVSKSQPDLARNMKATAASTMAFLFANHVYTKNGKRGLLTDKVYETGRIFFDQMSKADVDGSQFGDYYEYMRRGLKLIKTPKLPPSLTTEFNKRLGLADSLFAEANKNQIAFLGNQSQQKAVKESLRMRYGDSPNRTKALETVLKNVDVKDVGGRPVFDINVSAIHTEWKAMLEAPLATDARNELVQAMNYVLKSLFERGGKMQFFWGNDFEETENFYDTIKRSLLSEKSKELDSLVSWARGKAVEAGVSLTPGTSPHTPLRKYALITEFGVAGLGTAGAFAFHFGAKDDKNIQYYGTGASIIVGGAGLGAAGGNLLSYGLDVNPKYQWIFDVGGMLLGGLGASLIYGGVTGWKPNGGMITMPPTDDPARRNPVDPYGP